MVFSENNLETNLFLQFLVQLVQDDVAEQRTQRAALHGPFRGGAHQAVGQDAAAQDLSREAQNTLVRYYSAQAALSADRDRFDRRISTNRYRPRRACPRPRSRAPPPPPGVGCARGGSRSCVSLNSGSKIGSNNSFSVSNT